MKKRNDTRVLLWMGLFRLPIQKIRTCTSWNLNLVLIPTLLISFSLYKDCAQFFRKLLHHDLILSWAVKTLESIGIVWQSWFGLGLVQSEMRKRFTWHQRIVTKLRVWKFIMENICKWRQALVFLKLWCWLQVNLCLVENYSDRGRISHFKCSVS